MSTRRWIMLGIVAGTLVFLGAWLLFRTPPASIERPSPLFNRAYTYCRAQTESTEELANDFEFCASWIALLNRAEVARVYECDREAGDNAFATCLVRRNVIPPGAR